MWCSGLPFGGFRAQAKEIQTYNTAWVWGPSTPASVILYRVLVRGPMLGPVGLSYLTPYMVSRGHATSRRAGRHEVAWASGLVSLQLVELGIYVLVMRALVFLYNRESLIWGLLSADIYIYIYTQMK